MLVGQSRDTVGHVSRIYGVHRPVELVPLGIVRPPSRIQGDRARFGIPAEAFVMVSVGRVVPRKAAPQLVRVLAAAGAGDMYLLVVGDGPECEAVRHLAAELGVADRVRLLGHVSEQEKNEALSIADIFVSTSQHEGFGLVFLEAMAVGLPVVCYDRGGQTDFLSGLASGAVVRLNDIDSFTRSVMDLYHSRGRRSAVRSYNLARVEDFFIEQCATRYEALFRKALQSFGKH
jgi:glycosyltransferase involved in cell wall biosynthesis